MIRHTRANYGGSPEAELYSEQLGGWEQTAAVSPPQPLSERDSAKHALDELVSNALAYRTGPELRELLEFSCRFKHMAPYNAMLLHVQNPGIRYALSRADWKSHYRRQVKPGARAYVVLIPFGPVRFVFDLSDTEPIDPAWDRVPEQAINPFGATGLPPESAIPNMIKNCAKLRIQVSEADLATHLAGYVQTHTSPGWDFFLQLNAKHKPATRFGTFVHELGHVFCGHLGESKDGFWMNRRGAALASRELEAEAVAYLVTRRLGVDVGSAGYLAGYISANKPLPDYSLDHVLTAAGKIEDMIHDRFRLKKR